MARVATGAPACASAADFNRSDARSLRASTVADRALKEAVFSSDVLESLKVSGYGTTPVARLIA